MLFTRFIVSALFIGVGIAANPRVAITARSNEFALNALQTLRTDVQTQTAIIKENALFTSILNENSTATAAIQGAVSSIVDSITKTTQAIQAAPAHKRQSTTTDPVTQIAYILNDIAFGLVSALLSVVGTITGSSTWQNLSNPLLQAFTELSTALDSLLDNIPGFQAIADSLTSALNALPL